MATTRSIFNASSARRILLAMSGGVDSSVAALLLQRQGFVVEGMYMHNWDLMEESGNCQTDSDFQSMKRVCKALGIREHRVNFVKEYWNEVFSDTLRLYMQGWTPNPDVMCNQHIKFKALAETSDRLGIDSVATGHYARIFKNEQDHIHLHRAVDENKDQTYFLAHVSPKYLTNIMFPVGHLTKTEVKKIAQESGFGDIATKKESAGLCFVGKRKFQTFISEYIPDSPGEVIDVDRGSSIGTHAGVHLYTAGQRARVGGCQRAYYVVGKDVATRQLLVGDREDHPAMFCREFGVQEVQWITECAQQALHSEGGRLECMVRYRHRQPLFPCTLARSHNLSGRTTKYVVQSEKPLRAVAPGQVAVFYIKEECLGGAVISEPGMSCSHENFASEHLDRIII